jgi:Flp pilus assembly protein TadD
MSVSWAILLSALQLVPSAPDGGEARLAAARMLAAEGNDAQALSALEALSRGMPTWAPAHRELAREALKLGKDLDLAELHLELARSLAPEDAATQYLYGMLMEERQKPVAARDALRLAVDLNPEDLDARFRLGTLALNGRDWPEALEQFSVLKQRKPDWLGPRIGLADAFEQQGQGAQAEQELLSLRAQAPRSSLVTRRLASFYDRTGRPELAKRLLAELETPAAPKRTLKRSKR